MPKKTATYSTAAAADRLREAFANQGQTVIIPMRKCQDVPNFLKKLDQAQAVARKNNIQFD